MAILTAKARQFIEWGIDDAADFHQRKIWHTWAQANPDARGPGEAWQDAMGKLPEDVVATALYVLEHIARRKRQQLEWQNLSEDEVADIDNDLSYIQSLERFILRGIPERAH
jgi:hypothetical protein